MRRLRAKLGPEYESLIGTVRNVGYKAVRPARGRPSAAGSDLDDDLDSEAGDDYDGADSIDGFDHGGVPEALDNALRSQ